MGRCKQVKLRRRAAIKMTHLKEVLTLCSGQIFDLMLIQLQEKWCWLGILPSSSRPKPAAPSRSARHKAGAALWAQLAGAPPGSDPVHLVSPCARAGPAVGPGVSHACSGRWIQDVPQMLHIKITSVMCFHFPPEEKSAPLLPSLPSLRQHIFVRLHSHFSFLQAVLFRSCFPLFLMTVTANDGPVRDAHRPAQHRCPARRCRDSAL